MHAGQYLGLCGGQAGHNLPHIFGVRIVIQLAAQFFASGKDIFRGQRRVIAAALAEQIAAKERCGCFFIEVAAFPAMGQVRRIKPAYPVLAQA